MAVCHNVRIFRCKLLHGKAYHGYNSSKKQFFYGFKASVIVRENGLPIKLDIVSGSTHDLSILKKTDLYRFPKRSSIVGDAAYLSNPFKNELKERDLHLITDRRSNALEPIPLQEWRILKGIRKTIETAISGITSLMPRTIHAVTEAGIKMKILGFVLAFGFTKLAL